MAGVVLGVGTSHSPMLSLSPSSWEPWGKRDASNPMLFDRSGAPVSFESLVADAPAGLASELCLEVYEEKSARCHAALDRLGEAIVDARLDVMVVVGDDQNEHLGNELLPSILIYHGASLRNTAAVVPPDAPVEIAEMLRGYYEDGADRDYPVDVAAAEYLIAGLLDRNFDVATSTRMPKDRAEGHALQFPHRRVLPADLPVVPILLNTYLPPSQPRASRCWDLGAAIAAVFASYPGAERVGVLGSGGLSHFIVWEDLDHELLEAFGRGDEAYFRALPEGLLKAGTSEIKNWITTAAACSALRFETVDYVPGYRTPAATGTGLAFGVWR